MNKKNGLLAVAVGFVTVLALAFVLSLAQTASAQNVSINDFPEEQTGAPQLLELYDGDVITTATQYGPILDIVQYDAAELQWSLAASSTNTTTLGYQYSNDEVNWVTVQLTSTVGEVAGWSTATVTGAKLRFYVSAVAGADTVTGTATVASSAVFEPVVQ